MWSDSLLSTISDETTTPASSSTAATTSPLNYISLPLAKALRVGEHVSCVNASPSFIGVGLHTGDVLLYSVPRDGSSKPPELTKRVSGEHTHSITDVMMAGLYFAVGDSQGMVSVVHAYYPERRWGWQITAKGKGLHTPREQASLKSDTDDPFTYVALHPCYNGTEAYPLACGRGDQVLLVSPVVSSADGDSSGGITPRRRSTLGLKVLTESSAKKGPICQVRWSPDTEEEQVRLAWLTFSGEVVLYHYARRQVLRTIPRSSLLSPAGSASLPSFQWDPHDSELLINWGNGLQAISSDSLTWDQPRVWKASGPIVFAARYGASHLLVVSAGRSPTDSSVSPSSAVATEVYVDIVDHVTLQPVYQGGVSTCALLPDHVRAACTGYLDGSSQPSYHYVLAVRDGVLSIRPPGCVDRIRQLRTRGTEEPIVATALACFQSAFELAVGHRELVWEEPLLQAEVLLMIGAMLQRAKGMTVPQQQDEQLLLVEVATHFIAVYVKEMDVAAAAWPGWVRLYDSIGDCAWRLADCLPDELVPRNHEEWRREAQYRRHCELLSLLNIHDPEQARQVLITQEGAEEGEGRQSISAFATVLPVSCYHTVLLRCLTHHQYTQLYCHIRRLHRVMDVNWLKTAMAPVVNMELAKPSLSQGDRTLLLDSYGLLLRYSYEKERREKKGSPTTPGSHVGRVFTLEDVSESAVEMWLLSPQSRELVPYLKALAPAVVMHRYLSRFIQRQEAAALEWAVTVTAHEEEAAHDESSPHTELDAVADLAVSLFQQEKKHFLWKYVRALPLRDRGEAARRVVRQNPLLYVRLGILHDPEGVVAFLLQYEDLMDPHWEAIEALCRPHRYLIEARALSLARVPTEGGDGEERGLRLLLCELRSATLALRYIHTLSSSHLHRESSGNGDAWLKSEGEEEARNRLFNVAVNICVEDAAVTAEKRRPVVHLLQRRAARVTGAVAAEQQTETYESVAALYGCSPEVICATTTTPSAALTSFLEMLPSTEFFLIPCSLLDALLTSLSLSPSVSLASTASPPSPTQQQMRHHYEGVDLIDSVDVSRLLRALPPDRFLKKGIAQRLVALSRRYAATYRFGTAAQHMLQDTVGSSYRSLLQARNGAIEIMSETKCAGCGKLFCELSEEAREKAEWRVFRCGHCFHAGCTGTVNASTVTRTHRRAVRQWLAAGDKWRMEDHLSPVEEEWSRGDSMMEECCAVCSTQNWIRSMGTL